MTAPRVGTTGQYFPPNRPQSSFQVVRVEGNLCWSIYEGNPEATPFIWRHNDGLNAMHDWPGKEGKIAPCPGYSRA